MIMRAVAAQEGDADFAALVASANTLNQCKYIVKEKRRYDESLLVGA